MKRLLGKVLLVLVGLLLVGGIAGGAAYWAATTVVGSGGAKPKPAEKSATAGAVFDAGDYTTNLADPSGRRVIRVKVELSLSDQKALAELDKHKGDVRNAILMVLRSKQAEEVQGSQGQVNLGRDIQAKVAPLVTPGKINNVNFLEFVVQ